MDVLACRDICNAFEWMSQLREITETTPFQCKVLIHPHYRVGVLRIEYQGHSEREIRDCDLKLTAKIITFFETKGTRSIVLLPLEFGPRYALGLADKEAA